jgi:short-subunit dehydrogenase
VLPYFQEQEGGGVLINMSSLWGRMFSPYVSAYTTSKFGVRAFSEGLREALAEVENVDVCTILPASVDTPIFRHAGNYSGRAAKPVPPSPIRTGR